MPQETYIEIGKLLSLFFGGVGVEYIRSKFKGKKDDKDADLALHQQLIDQYNHVIKRVDRLEKENSEKSEEIVKWQIKYSQLEAKHFQLETKLTDEFNYLAVMQSCYAHMARPAWLKDPNGVMYFINDEYENIYGVSKLAYEGQVDENIYNTDVAERFKFTDTEVIVKKQGIVYKDFIPIYKDGEYVQDDYVEVVKFPVMHKGRLIGVCGVVCRRLNEEDNF